jgi:hypothetical protein
MEHGLKKQLDDLHTDIEAKVISSKSELDVLSQNLKENQKSLENHQHELDQARSRYDDAVAKSRNATVFVSNLESIAQLRAHLLKGQCRHDVLLAPWATTSSGRQHFCG